MTRQAKPYPMSLNKAWLTLSLALMGAAMLPMPTRAQGLPEISPNLKKMLGALPIADLKDEVHGMVGALKQTSCGGGLKGCYTTRSGPIQLYFFTSNQAQQTFLVVVDKKMPLPKLLKDNVQKVFGGTSLERPIISISTSDFDLDTTQMPPDLQKVVRDSYFNVDTLSFSSGVQLAARASVGGAIKTAMQSLGVQADQVTLRAAVVMPIPTDLMGGVGTGVGIAGALADGDTMKKAGADAVAPEAFVELQFAPNARLPLISPRMDLTDATFFINNSLTFGYKGNAMFPGVKSGKVMLQFQTPLTPEGGMDLLDFSFRMATPASFSLEDAAYAMVAMATPDPRLAKYGGGYIRNIESIKKPLLAAAKPLSVFKMNNPVPHAEYKFGDKTKPFPEDPKYFNIIIAGPLADGGPMMKYTAGSNVLGQSMGMMDVFADIHGFSGKVVNGMMLKLGPLGKVGIQMTAEAAVDKAKQMVRLKGNYLGQVVEVILDGNTLSIDVPANCVNPFEIKTKVTFEASTNIADVFEGQGGANVDPSKIQGCVGKQLEAAYNKVANEYKHLSGYSAKEASQALHQMDAGYQKAKNAARDAQEKATNAAVSAFNDAGNAFKRIGKKKHKKKGPDPKFAASVFDWDYYYDNAPDVVRKGMDLATHWREHGFEEGRQGSPEFSAKFYWNRYLDVQKLCAKEDQQCALKHWIDQGLETGRQGSADFSVVSYLKRYSDLQRAFGPDGYEEAFEHWLQHGDENGRNGRPESDMAGPIYGPSLVGGDGGSTWSDLDKCDGSYVNGFRVRAGDMIDAVQFSYAGKGWADMHGNPNGGSLKANVKLAEGEYIVRVDHRGGSKVDSVSFKTNLGKTYGPYGGGGGSAGTFMVMAGDKLGCMKGRSGSLVDQLVFSSTGPR